MPHETLLKFNYPNTLLREYQHWAVLLRPKQVTVGSLVLICTEDARSFPAISAGGVAQEMQTVTRDIETTLKQILAFDKINYICLMMVDPQVHFHVLPRYAKTQLPSVGKSTLIHSGQGRPTSQRRWI